MTSYLFFEYLPYLIGMEMKYGLFLFFNCDAAEKKKNISNQDSTIIVKAYRMYRVIRGIHNGICVHKNACESMYERGVEAINVRTCPNVSFIS